MLKRNYIYINISFMIDDDENESKKTYLRGKNVFVIITHHNY